MECYLQTKLSSAGVIVLADDEVTVRNLCRTILQREGYFVMCVADGSEALELSRSYAGAIDLLLTDVVMPHLDGVSVCRQVKAERPNVEVLFMSGRMSGQLAIPPSLSFFPKPFLPHA